jgi:hypothetical protein
MLICIERQCGFAMVKETPDHRDQLGRLLKVGDCVAYPQSNSLVIGVVRKINPKMVGVRRIGKNGWGSEKNKYPVDCVRLDGPEVTMFIIKNSEENK